MQENDLRQGKKKEEEIPFDQVPPNEPELPNLDLKDELAKAQAKAAENYDLFMRAKAETENVRRRASEDVAKARKYGIEKFADALIPVMDSAEKALQATKDMKGPLHDGMVAIERQLMSALESNGMQCEDPLGQKFDPNTMQAIASVPSDKYPSGHVTEVFQKGWKLSGRVLRPAMVAVAQ